MRKLYIILLISTIASISTFAATFPNETLNYKVMYKWGLIHKQAGSVKISINNSGEYYNAILTASSAPWADKYYKVRDTLTVNIVKKTLRPTVYDKISHEGNEDKHDKVVFTQKGATVIGNCTRFAKKNGKITKDERRTLEATGTTLDMFSAFYYMRQLPFSTWQNGHVTTLNIFSGKQKELLTITYKGVEKVEYDKKSHICYKITFVFTSDGKKKSSDDMEAWIDTRTLIPIKLEGKLPVGSVKAFFTGTN